MNDLVLVGILFFTTIPLTWGMCELIDYFARKVERNKQTHYVYKSRKLNKTIDVDKVGE